MNGLTSAVNGSGEVRFGPGVFRTSASPLVDTLWFLVLSKTGNESVWALSDLLPLFLCLFLLNMIHC